MRRIERTTGSACEKLDSGYANVFYCLIVQYLVVNKNPSLLKWKIQTMRGCIFSAVAVAYESVCHIGLVTKHTGRRSDRSCQEADGLSVKTFA